ncbi:dihydropteroate synthase [Pedobacter sp. CYS-01]|uniref:dihydropteroate synthase n=2 Tax=Pedobacter montanisoli TaxID=2923277 RepID=A0ABS9ZRB8_9SPHI|nr:dihydropteroate synthase [Pedobacter montanisoli]MCJ0741137.1 dihydropteroate synthase [Pedobacter montanisoli]
MAKDTFLNRKLTLNCKGRLVDLSQPQVMAIINLTPDSFYGSSRVNVKDELLLKVENFIKEGAAFIDLGAYSSRPGALNISSQEETDRLLPAVEEINKQFPNALISIDTFRADVAEKAINAGAHIINDIAAGNLDDQMFATVAKLGVPYIMMHMKGTPQNMQQDPVYNNLTEEVLSYFLEKVDVLKKQGVKDMIIDPGFGFAKTLEHNYELLKNMEALSVLELPILVGVSRKSMICKLLNIKPEEALNGTSVLNTVALLKGANILRVHDVKEAVECVRLIEYCK